MSTLDMALLYDHLGCSVLPLQSRSKKPAIRRWKEYQHRRPDRDELREWFAGGRRNIAIVCGEVSERLIVRDFDSHASYEDWRAKYPDAAASLPAVATWRGFHIYGRSAVTVSTRCLDDGELRSTGAYVVAPPSLHPEGMAYTWTIPPGDDIPVIDLTASGLLPVTQEIGGVQRGDYSCVTQRDASHLTVGDDLTEQFITRAIRKTQPDGPGQRHRCVFELTRYLKQIDAIAGQEAGELEPILWRWFRVALPTIRTKDFGETRKDFEYAWREVRIPVGVTLQAAAERADESLVAASVKGRNKRRLAATCRELQLMHGSNPFFLDCRNAGLLLGVSYRTALRMLHSLCRRGVMEKVSTGSFDSGRANEYRYVGG